MTDRAVILDTSPSTMDSDPRESESTLSTPDSTEGGLKEVNVDYSAADGTQEDRDAPQTATVETVEDMAEAASPDSVPPAPALAKGSESFSTAVSDDEAATEQLQPSSDSSLTIAPDDELTQTQTVSTVPLPLSPDSSEAQDTVEQPSTDDGEPSEVPEEEVQQFTGIGTVAGAQQEARVPGA